MAPPNWHRRIGTAELAPRAGNGTYYGTAADRAAENAITEMAPVPKNGTKNGTATDLATKNGTAEMAPRAENGTHYGSAPANGQSGGIETKTGTR